MDFPKDLRYTENDEWIRTDGNTATAGITDYAQDQLSDIVYIEFTGSTGDLISKGESYAIIESVKAAADIYMPIGGTVMAFNEALGETPEVVNVDPYGEAWMVKFEIADAAELDGLLDSSAYEKRCKERET